MRHHNIKNNIKKIQNRCNTLVKSLDILYKDINDAYIVMDSMNGNNKIPTEDKKAYKEEFNLYRELVQRKAIDRIFLQKLEIITPPPSKTKPKSVKTPKGNTTLNQIGKMASVIRTDNMTEAEKAIIASILDNLKEDLK